MKTEPMHAIKSASEGFEFLVVLDDLDDQDNHGTWETGVIIYSSEEIINVSALIQSPVFPVQLPGNHIT